MRDFVVVVMCLHELLCLLEKTPPPVWIPPIYDMIPPPPLCPVELVVYFKTIIIFLCIFYFPAISISSCYFPLPLTSSLVGGVQLRLNLITLKPFHDDNHSLYLHLCFILLSSL